MPDAETVGKIRYTLSAEQNTRVPSCGGISRMAIYIRLARNAGKGKGGGQISCRPNHCKYDAIQGEHRPLLPRPHGGANSGVYRRWCSFHIFPSARARIIVRERRVLNCGNYVFLDFSCPRNALSSGRRSLVGWRGSKETRS